MTVLDCIRLKAMTVECIVGVYPSERKHPQPLELEIELFFDSRAAAYGGGLASTVDYARLCGELRFLLHSSQFLLLEEAAEALCRYVLAQPTDDMPRVAVEQVTLTLTKPKALAGNAVPSLTITRQREQMTYERERKPFGRVDIIYQTDACGIYRLRVAPGQSIPPHIHKKMEEHELVLGDALIVQNETARSGTGRSWPKDFVHGYHNPSDIEQTILCVDRPRFDPDDEIVVEPVPMTLTTIEAREYYPQQEAV